MDAERRFAAWAKAMAALGGDDEGERRLAALGVSASAAQRSVRLPIGGAAEGLSVMEAVVIAGVAGRLLSDASFMRWASRVHPGAVASLHAVADAWGATHCQVARG